MPIIKEELKKIYHFLIILLILYTINLGFNMNYDWGGVSVIVRVYIMVLSCYVIYNFSQLNSGELKGEYEKMYGKPGILYLFFSIRVFPFLFIYLLTVIFTLINYIQNQAWPMDGIVKLLDGRYANTVIYALILFVVLRLKVRPGIAIPVFIASAFFYFYTDKLLYALFEPGLGVSVIKTAKFALFYFILVFGFTGKRHKILYSSIAGAVCGSLTFLLIIFIQFAVFSLSDEKGRVYSLSSRILLKYGCYQIFDEYEKTIAENEKVREVRDLILFSGKSGREISFSPEMWENFILKSRASDYDVIFRYLIEKKIHISYMIIRDFALIQSYKNDTHLLQSESFKRYYAMYYGDNSKDFFILYNSGNILAKKLIIAILAHVKEADTVLFLIDRLTDVNRDISESAYLSLKHITGIDPAASDNKEIHDIEVGERFREYAEKIRRE